MTEVINTEPAGNGDGPSSAETTHLAESIGEHEARIEDVETQAEEAAQTSESAIAAATAAAVHEHPDHVTHDTLAQSESRVISHIDERLEEMKGLLLPPPPPEPEALKEPDDPPKSREKRVKRRSLADRFYGKS
jgi:hypothetical protein